MITVASVAGLILIAIFTLHGKGQIPIRTVTVARAVLRSQISTNGKVEPIRNFEAHAPAPTSVKRILVHEGDRVKAGQLLMLLDDAEARSQASRAIAQLRGAEADLNAVQNGGTHEEVLATEAELVKARADLASAQTTHDAVQRLFDKGAASTAELRDAESQLKRTGAQAQLMEQKRKNRYSTPEVIRVQAQVADARAALVSARALLGKSEIRAPQAGIVYSLPVREGSYVNQGDLLLASADLSTVLVRTFVDEADVGRLAPKQPIEVTWDALAGRVWKGSVSMVPASVKLLNTRNVGELTCILENKDMKLLPNINVGVSIITAEDNVLFLPREAVRMADSKAFVYQIAEGTLKRREVQTSISNLTQIGVSGLSEGTAVALNSVNNKALADGASVKVVQ